jgi:DNA excision repair protein ERCC-6
MPGKTEQVLFCKLSKRQRRMYESYLESDEVQRILRNRGGTDTFKPIITLRKICNHPHLIVGPDLGSYETFIKHGIVSDDLIDDCSLDENSMEDLYDEQSLLESSGKLMVLSKILPLWKQQGHRVLIFSQWKKTLDIIQQFINMMGWDFGRMDGNTNVAARQKLVDRFNSDETLFGMLLTTKTGGVGLVRKYLYRICKLLYIFISHTNYFRDNKEFDWCESSSFI